MGISQFMYLLAWLVYYLLNAFLVSLLMMLIFAFGVSSHDEFKYADGYGIMNVVLIYFIYAFSIIGFVLLISNFFSKAKTAAQVLISSNVGSHLYPACPQFPVLLKVFQRS